MIESRRTRTKRWCGGIRVVLAAALVLGAGIAQPSHAHADERPALGPAGEEGAPLRRQDWLVPAPKQKTRAHARLYRPPGRGPFPLALIAHASTQSPLQRAQMPMPDYTGLVRTFIARGYAVIVPQRPGHGATGGRYLEDQNGCLHADYASAGNRTADSIQVALDFMLKQDFIRREGAIVVGHSAGGWGALALAARNPKAVSRIIVFAPGRGGRAEGMANSVCAQDRLIAASAEFGRGARVPVTWLVAENDSYFSPALSKEIADALAAGGAKIDFRVLPAYGRDGHGLAEAGQEALKTILQATLK